MLASTFNSQSCEQWLPGTFWTPPLLLLAPTMHTLFLPRRVPCSSESLLDTSLSQPLILACLCLECSSQIVAWLTHLFLESFLKCPFSVVLYLDTLFPCSLNPFSSPHFLLEHLPPLNILYFFSFSLNIRSLKAGAWWFLFFFFFTSTQGPRRVPCV